MKKDLIQQYIDYIYLFLYLKCVLDLMPAIRHDQNIF